MKVIFEQFLFTNVTFYSFNLINLVFVFLFPLRTIFNANV